MNNDKIASIIYETMEYNKFNFIESNRGINGNNVANLKESMNKKALPIAVIVNEKYEMIDFLHEIREARLFSLIVLEEGVDLYLQKLQPLLGVAAHAILLRYFYRDLQIFPDASLVHCKNHPAAALGAGLF